MSSLKYIDRIKLEKFLNMGGGYVCDFFNKTFRDFIFESTGVDVYADGYEIGGTSKANRLRTFWKKERDHLTARLLRDMLEYWKAQKTSSHEGFKTDDESAYQECLKIIERLENGSIIENLDALNPNSFDSDFSLLAVSIKESIQKGEQNQVLDRLHTFVVKYMRELCKKHSIDYNKQVSLHSLFASYKKYIADKKVIESEMAERILKSFISILDAFNTVRNNQSFAHDNPILNPHESALIVSNISSILKFIGYIETKLSEQTKRTRSEMETWENVPTEEEIEAAADAWIQLEIDSRRGK